MIIDSVLWKIIWHWRSENEEIKMAIFEYGVWFFLYSSLTQTLPVRFHQLSCHIVSSFQVRFSNPRTNFMSSPILASAKSTKPIVGFQKLKPWVGEFGDI